MKNFHIYTLVLTGVLLHLLAISCFRMEEMDISDTDVLVFTASLESTDTPDTRSFSTHITSESEDWALSPITQGSIRKELEGKVTVIGMLSKGAEITPWNELNNLNDDNKKQFQFDGDELYSEASVRWGTIREGYDKLNLYLCTPNTIDINTNSNSASLQYIIPDDIRNHQDIITAYKEVSSPNFGQNIPITFEHALTALKFKSGFDTDIIVRSVTVSGVRKSGTYTIGSGWDTMSQGEVLGDYSIDFGETGKSVSPGKVISYDNDEGVMTMIPQTLNANASITLIYKASEDIDWQTISASLSNRTWHEGKLITYTLHITNTEGLDYIYFDLNAGDVTINNTTYTGKIFKNGSPIEVTGNHDTGNKYYVYQSTSKNKTDTGPTIEGFSLPDYDPVKVGDILWSDYIINNKKVEDVIEKWDNAAGAGYTSGKVNTNSNDGKHPNLAYHEPNLEGADGAVRKVGREATKNKIHIEGTLTDVYLVIDNIYSSYQEVFNRRRTTGGISFLPTKNGSSKLTINMIGDSRLGCINYRNAYKSAKNKTTDNALIFEGTGSLTVADVDFFTYKDDNSLKEAGYYSNRSCSVIGSCDLNVGDYTDSEDAYNIIINSGVIYAGATEAEYCTAIGGGGNGDSSIIINGGVVTAVAAGTGTAIGGGVGVSDSGGEGTVIINGGNIYAYNHANYRKIPTSAIGGAGSQVSVGKKGDITINGGNVYAESALGTAIGGGSSAQSTGGQATVTINDGYVVAKGGTAIGISSPGIGGGCAYTNPKDGTDLSSIDLIGGTATIKIGESGNPIIRTGSIGGGSSGPGGIGKIGSANITIYNGDIQAQFVMAASSTSQINRFKMYDGTVRNSYWNDSDYKHIQENGGAVYMKQGTFLMTGGVIKNCSGKLGGAIYIEGEEGANASFTMRLPEGNEPRATSAPAILQSTADQDGGAIYLKNGDVIITAGQIEKNLAKGGNGGGVCIEGGNFTMQGTQTSISKNAAYSKEQDQNRNNTNPEKKSGNGGGVYVSSEGRNVSVTIEAGKIEENSSDRYGGGFCVDISNNTEATVTIGVDNNSTSNTDPSITTNRASILGGGLYVSGDNANIDIFDGKINGNFIAGYSANENVTNVGGKVYLANATVDIDKVTVKYKTANGDLYFGSEKVEEIIQYIVKSTDNRIILPANTTITREGYTFIGWHTEQGGKKGTEGFINDNILNFDVDEITLWAVWE